MPSKKIYHRKTVESILLQRGILTQEQIDRAIAEQQKRDEYLHQIVVDLRMANPEIILTALAEEWGVEWIDIANEEELDKSTVETIPEPMAQRILCIPTGKSEDTLSVAMADPFNPFAVDEIVIRTHLKLKSLLAFPADVKRKLDEVYGHADSSNELLENILKGAEEATVEVVEEQQSVVDIAPSELDAQQAPVVILVNNIIFHGIKSKASDIHIEPFEKQKIIRYRIDGQLQESPFPIPQSLYNAVVSRFKIMAKCNIAERRLPHDGRIQIKYEGKSYDLRFSTVPTAYGESIVMRILDKGGVLLPLAQLGFSPYNLERFESCIKMPTGLLLVSGPTGHGKSTTLFSALNSINLPDRKILTAEDPIEYNLEGVVQIQAKSEIGLTFARILRAFLRQNPDVIMVGEIRDRETAQIGLEAALTGHLVFSTIHTNDAPSCVTRLVEMGVEPFLITDAMRLALSQRLAKTMCSACKEPTEPSEELLRAFEKYNIDTTDMQIFKQVTGQGCKVCEGTGMKGRTGIHEVLLMDTTIKELLLKGGSAYEIMQAARKGGMRTLREDGLYKVAQGKLSLGEVMKITQEV